MRNKTKNVLLSAAMAVLTLTLQAQVDYTLQAGDITIEDGYITDCSYDFSVNGGGTNLTIPEGLGITGIADGEAEFLVGYTSGTAPFAEQNITSIILPSTLTYLGDFAFYDNALSEIEITDGVTIIGREAFAENNIDSVFIPNGIKAIEHAAFSENNLLDTVVIEDNSQLIYLGAYSFYNTQVSELVLPTPVVPDDNFEHWIKMDGFNTTQNAGEKVFLSIYAFIAKFDYTLTDADVVVENGIIESCSYDFSGKYIIIPDELDGQNVTSIAATDQYGAVFFNKDIFKITLPSTLKVIGDFSFNYNNIDTLIIPASVETIGEYAFFHGGMDTVIFEPNCKLTSMGYSAFYGNTYLTMAFPDPSFEHYTLDHWIDIWTDDTYEAGVDITDFTTEYEAQLTLAPGASGLELDDELDFDDVYLLDSESETIDIHNMGNISFNVTNILLPDGFTSNLSSGEVAADEHLYPEITFTPTEEQDYLGYIVVYTDATINSVDSIEVMGTGEKEEVQSTESLSDIYVDYGTLEGDIDFHASIDITSDGPSTTLDISSITWSSDTYNATTPGSYEFTADITTAIDAANMDADIFLLTEVSINVIVEDEELQSIDVLDPISVPLGTLSMFIEFPTSLSITTNGSSTTLDISSVMWGNTDYSIYTSGTYTFTANIYHALSAAGISRGGISSIISISVIAGTTVISEAIASQNQFKVYPNPTAGNIIVQINQELDKASVLQMYDMTGNLLQSTEVKTSEIMLDLTGYPQSTYLLRLLTGRDTKSLGTVIKE